MESAGSKRCPHCGAELIIKHHSNKRFCNPRCRVLWHVKQSNRKRYSRINERYQMARQHGLTAKEAANCRSDAGYARLLERIERERNQATEEQAPENGGALHPSAATIAGGEEPQAG